MIAAPCRHLYKTGTHGRPGRTAWFCDEETENAMTSFDDREKSFEQKYKHDQDLQFKVNARRNKLLGLWAAEKMGLSGAEAEAYAKQVVQADFERPGDSDVIEKVTKDLEARSVAVSAVELRHVMDRLLTVAKEQIQKQG